MGKTVAAAERARRKGVPFLTVFTDPTMAGVLASYASIADVILAEPKALVGFAGARVSAQAGVGKVPNDFQTAEWVHSHGMVDRIVPRRRCAGRSPRSCGRWEATLADRIGWRRRTRNGSGRWSSWRNGSRRSASLAEREKDPVKRQELLKGRGRDRGAARTSQYRKVLYSNLGPWEKVLVARAESAAVHAGLRAGAVSRSSRSWRATVGGTWTTRSWAGRRCSRGVRWSWWGTRRGATSRSGSTGTSAWRKPEGYRKAIRLFDMAERFRMPVLTFVDTPAADPGVESEGRGISEAIAAGMMKMFELTVPSVSVVIGEGRSGGAIGIAASSRVLMLEHSVYSVIPPEGCAAILWRQPERGADAAKALRLTAQSALEYGHHRRDHPRADGRGAPRRGGDRSGALRDALRRNLIRALGAGRRDAAGRAVREVPGDGRVRRGVEARAPLWRQALPCLECNDSRKEPGALRWASLVRLDRPVASRTSFECSDSSQPFLSGEREVDDRGAERARERARRGRRWASGRPGRCG